jgi:hypothetical protein
MISFLMGHKKASAVSQVALFPRQGISKNLDILSDNYEFADKAL